jgi:site-specific DNA recombinase
MKRAVLYARVSGDDRGREGRNLAGQLEMCRKYAREHGYLIVAELAEDDRGASGAEIDLPQLNHVREMAQANEFDVLVVRELDRLSRNLAKQLIIEQELRRAGVGIEYVLGEYPDTPEGHLMKHVRATVAEYEREKINERMVRGRRQKAQAGHVMVHGKPPYGYKIEEVDGKQTLAIDEEEAQIVRLIFKWYVEGDVESSPLSMHEITRRLSQAGVLTKGDKDPNMVKTSERGKWQRSTVARMLHRETYAGVWHYGKRNGTNPDDYLIPVEVPAIVSRNMWLAAQARMEQNKADSKRNTRYNYLLRRRAICGDCGVKMSVRMTRNGRGEKGRGVHFYYYCPARGNFQFVRRCPRPCSFRADHVDKIVWEWVKSFLLEPDTLAEGLRLQQAEQERANHPLQERLTVVDDLLVENRSQLERVLDLYLSGDFDKRMLAERKARLEKTIDSLERERANLAAQLETHAITDEHIQTVVEFAGEIARGLEETDKSFESQRRLIELLDVWVTLTVEEEQKVAYARCLLGEDLLSVVSTNS